MSIEPKPEFYITIKHKSILQVLIKSNTLRRDVTINKGGNSSDESNRVIARYVNSLDVKI